MVGTIGVFDAVGLTDPALYLSCASYITPEGSYITAGTLPKGAAEWKGMARQVIEGVLRPRWLGGVPRKLGAVTALEPSDLWKISELVANVSIKPIVDSVHSFDREGVMGAYERLMTKRAVGKVVVRVADEYARGNK
ncbi:PKS-ER domain-containing protein [Mycena kentingensis (nom. inval.)]|nr:PKS-ER domain-containing protein [Mycena kentingensis (nom. inval.)]